MKQKIDDFQQWMAQESTATAETLELHSLSAVLHFVVPLILQDDKLMQQLADSVNKETEYWKKQNPIAGRMAQNQLDHNLLAYFPTLDREFGYQSSRIDEETFRKRKEKMKALKMNQVQYLREWLQNGKEPE